MKKAIVAIMKKTGEKAAEVPVAVKSWPSSMNQPKMPAVLREKMKQQDGK